MGVVEGSWLDGLTSDGRTVWGIHRDRPSDLLLGEEYLAAGMVLPSDSRYRKDIQLLLKTGNIAMATEATATIMDRQRHDANLRRKGAKSKGQQ